MMPRECVDILVIGAGVAGATAALSAASDAAGRANRILLIDRAAWPREKVCGCCLGARGVSALLAAGVSRGELATASIALETAQVRFGGRSLDLALDRSRPGMVIGRAQLDSIIVQHALANGVAFESSTSARIGRSREGDFWPVQLTNGTSHRTIHASTVIVADGLAGRSLDDVSGFEPVVARRARMGVGATAKWSRVTTIDGADALPDGRVVLCAARGGYVGLVRLPGGQVDIAAAMDPALVRSAGGPAALVASMLQDAGLQPSGLLPERFLGTALLTRSRSRLAAPGLLVVGDAAGYVEPFTGEGMTWAACGGHFAGVLAARHFGDELAAAWRVWHAENIRATQRTCRIIAAGLRVPWLGEMVVAAASASGMIRTLAQKVARSLSDEPAVTRQTTHRTPITEQGHA